ncbi:MAG TPA: hypothetical protein VFZ68_05445 [Acidimicrobiales bacterium]
MDIRLLRRPHKNPSVRASGIGPTDPYLEWCWGPVVGPSTTALVRRVAELTAPTGEAHVPFPELGRLLGLGATEAPTRNNKLVRTLVRAEQFGLGFTNVDAPGSLVTFGIHDRVALVPHRLLERLPEISRQHHAAAVVRVNEALADHGLPALRSPLPPGWHTERPGAATTGQAPVVAGRERDAVPPTARLDAISKTPHAWLEQSL